MPVGRAGRSGGTGIGFLAVSWLTGTDDVVLLALQPRDGGREGGMVAEGMQQRRNLG